MSLDKGYIKIYRDIRDHWIWEDEKISRGQAWIDLIMFANHEDKEILFNGRKIHVARGSFITSIKKLSAEWGWSRHKTSEFLNLLENEHMIEQHRDNKKTVITIDKYWVYQGGVSTSGTSKGQQKDIKRTSEGHQKDTNNTLRNTKEDTKKNKPPIPPLPEDENQNQETYDEKDGWYMP